MQQYLDSEKYPHLLWHNCKLIHSHHLCPFRAQLDNTVNVSLEAELCEEEKPVGLFKHELDLIHLWQIGKLEDSTPSFCMSSISRQAALKELHTWRDEL